MKNSPRSNLEWEKGLTDYPKKTVYMDMLAQGSAPRITTKK
jgi:hypothetical protein